MVLLCRNHNICLKEACDQQYQTLFLNQENYAEFQWFGWSDQIKFFLQEKQKRQLYLFLSESRLRLMLFFCEKKNKN